MYVKTHQSEGKEQNKENYTAEHGEAQQEYQRLILADAGVFAVECLISELLVIQQVLSLGWHG